MSDVKERYDYIPKRKPLNRFRVIKTYTTTQRLILTLQRMEAEKAKRIIFTRGIV